MALKRRIGLLAGATGLVGAHCLRLLLADERYERVVAVVRRGLPVNHPKLLQRVLDFEWLAELGELPRVHDVFCCLGTTMKKAGSQAAFRRVDLDYVRELARLASEAGAAQFLLVSALGADPASRIFYNRVKGEAEDAVKRTRFDGVHIFRPSLLVGDRAEFRPGERVGIAISRVVAPLLVGALRKYRPIAAETVARAMVRVAGEARKGVRVYPSDRIQTLGVQP